MKGMIAKDLLVLKSTMKTVVIIILVFGFMGSMGGNNMMSTFASVYAAILPMTCMAYDERCNFNRFAMTMPVTHREIVLSKYITGLILGAVAAVISAVMLLVGGKINAMDFVAGIVTALLIPMLYHTVLIPVMFKVGVEKSRVVIMIIMVVPIMALTFLAEYGVFDGIINALSNQSVTVIAVIGAAAIVAAYILSIFVSFAICKKKQW